MGDELFHADGQTGMMKLIVAFRNFANASKNAANNYNPRFSLPLCYTPVPETCTKLLRLNGHTIVTLILRALRQTLLRNQQMYL